MNNCGNCKHWERGKAGNGKCATRDWLKTGEIFWCSFYEEADQIELPIDFMNPPIEEGSEK